MVDGAAVQQHLCDVIEQQAVAPGYMRLTLHAPHVVGAHAGQFVQIGVAETGGPLLRRPFSVMTTESAAGSIQILYRVTGTGTALLSRQPCGAQLSVLGPLGHGFDTTDVQAPILVGGGVGIPPLLLLARQQISSGAWQPNQVLILQGARGSEHVLCTEDFTATGAELQVATEDGSVGWKGLVTDLLTVALAAEASGRCVFTCGPHAMMHRVAEIAGTRHVPCQVSLEAMMPCGFGICMGCVVEMQTGSGYDRYRRVCKDGPVFDATAVKWE